MKNHVRRNIDREAGGIGDNIVYGGFLTVLLYGLGLAEGDAAGVASAVGFWALFYALYSPYLVRSIAIREPPGDAWGAAAYVAYGGLPLFLYIPFWSELTAWPASIAAYPAVALWASVALILAGFGRAPRSPAGRRFLLASGGAIFAVAAGPVYLGFVIAAFTGAWRPPEGGAAITTFAMLGGLPIAGLAAYAAIELLGRANTAAPAAQKP